MDSTKLFVLICAELASSDKVKQGRMEPSYSEDCA